MSDDTIKELDFKQFFLKTLQGHVEAYLHPTTHFAPFLNEYDLIEPFKRNKKNRMVFSTFLDEIIAASKDKNSILHHMVEQNEFDYDKIVHDLIALFVASAETSSHTATSMMYYLKKYPDVMKKLEAELLTHFEKFTDNEGKITKEKIQELDYLNNVLKETLRIDPPGIESLLYKTYEDITICGVDIPKNMPIVIDILSAHYNKEEWIDPFKFIPERFDSGSKYFLKPNSDKPRSPHSFVAFSQGSRSCPGQTLAMLELKVILSYILCKIDYEIDQKMLDRDDIGFAIASNIELEFTVTAK